MSRRRLIALSGMDCAGKTTQIDLLYDWAEQRGWSPRVLWYRPGYSPLLNALRRTLRRAAPSSLPAQGNRTARDQALSRPWVRNGWLVAALLDTAIHYGLVVRTQLWRRRFVICDRHLEDAELDLLLAFPERSKVVATTFFVIKALSPVPHHQFLLTIPLEEIGRRSAEKNEPFPDDPKTRSARNAAYLRISAQEGRDVFSGLLARETIHAAIVATLERTSANP
jgi:thymidylate kinase